MQVIDVHPPLTAALVPSQPIVLALGFFDGVHCGHQAVIARAKREADQRGLKLAVMTFDVHPAVIYRGVAADQVKYLSPRPRKIELMADCGVDLLYFVHFTDAFAALKPQAFVDQYLVGLNAAVVVAGFDYTYGKHDIANMQTLPRYARERFAIITVPKAVAGGQKVSSTRVRKALDEGDVDLANHLLGYRYQTSGTVVHGEARGRTIGYPTANVQAPANERIPGIAVYVVRLKVLGHWYPGMASVGRNITFGPGRPVTVEVNLFAFHQDIYGEPVRVEWVHRLRGDMMFDSAAGLVKQLGQDEQDAVAYLKELTD